MIAASLGYKEREFELPEGTTLQAFLELIHLPVDRRWTITSVNGTIKGKETQLSDGDNLLVAPVGGGG